jgi:thiamine-phosphate pyrophosphorylase
MPCRTLPAGFYAVCDDTVRTGLSLTEQAGLLLQGGARVLQLRMKRTPTRQAVEVVRQVVALARPRQALVLVNDRVDQALVGGADGVHLGEEDLPVSAARALLGREAVVGATVRSAEEARAAHQQGADYVGMGPLYGTQTKVVAAPVMGLERFAREVALCPLPVVGIGGVTLARMEEVGASGAHAAAVISDVLLQEDIPARAAALQAAFERGRLLRRVEGL